MGQFNPFSGLGSGGGGGGSANVTISKYINSQTGEVTYKLEDVDSSYSQLGSTITFNGNGILIDNPDQTAGAAEKVSVQNIVDYLYERSQATYNFTTFTELGITTSGKTLRQITNELIAKNLPQNTVVTGQLYSDALPFSGNGEAEVLVNHPAYWWTCKSLNVAPYSWNALTATSSWGDQGVILDWVPDNYADDIATLTQQVEELQESNYSKNLMPNGTGSEEKSNSWNIPLENEVTYVISFESLTSDDTDSTTCLLRFYDNFNIFDINDDIQLSRGNNVVQEFTLGTEINVDHVTLYASNTPNNSNGDNVSFVNAMICTKEEWDQSHEFAPYIMDNKDLTDKLLTVEEGAQVNVQSDWNQSDTEADDFIRNKPSLGTAASADTTTSIVSGGTGLPTSGTVYTDQQRQDAVIAECVDGGAKNVLNFDSVSRKTSGNATFTYNGDGSITVNMPTANPDSSEYTFLRLDEVNLDVKDFCTGGYMLSGCPTNNSGVTLRVQYGSNYLATDSGSASHAEGYGTAASNSYAHAEGYGTTASGSSSHAEGQDSTASGNLSHAEGYNTQATHSQAHAEGRYTKAQASEAHAEGNSTTASNSAAHAEGDNTTASGNASHSEGMNTTASSAASHAEGLYTIAASANQHVEGKYNISDSSNKYAHIIGNGTGENSRSNAFAVDWNGEIYTNNRTDSIQDEIGVIANLGAKNFYKIEGIYPDVGTANSIVINADQTITYTQISVATSDVTKKFVANPFTLPAGKYILTCAENESFSTYDTYLYNEDLSPASTIARGIEGYQEFTLTQPTNVNLYFRVRANYQYSTITLKPMIRRAEIEDDTFMPYAPTNRELYEDKINIGDVFGIGADIPENSDLNNYTTIGIYRCARSSTAQTLSNCPTNQAFKLEVRITAAETRLSQVIYSNSTIPEVYVRTYTTNGWSLWYPYVSTINMLVNTGVKNLIIPTNPASISGVTVTRNDDGSLTFVCTSVSENKLFKIGDFAVPNASKIYILSGCSGGSTSTYMLGIYDGSTAKIYQTTDEVAYTGNLSTYIARVRIIAGYTGTFTVYPMLRDASVVDSTYKQYGMTNPELTRRSNAVPELVNNGSKNLATVTSGTNSADRFAIIPFSSDAPAGYYCLSIGNLVSDDTDASTCYFAAYDSSGTAASAVYQLTRGQNIVQSLVTTRPTAFLRLYPSDNSSHSANDTVTFTDLMFCSEADWQASKSYIDYLPSNKEINAEINTLVNTGSKNMIFGTDLQRIKNANTSGTWTNNVYVYNNVEYTVNSDGTVSVKTLNGASTAAGSLLLPCKPLTGSAVILSGCPAGSNAGANFNLRWGSSSTYMDIGAGKTITTTGTNDVYLRVGDAINIPTAILFKPMMRDATITDNTFVMYAPSLPDIANWEEYDVLYRTSTTAADLLDMTNSSATLRVNRALKTACLNFSVKVKTGKTIPSTQSAFNFVTITGVTNYKEIYINQPARTYIINSSYTVTIAKGAGNAVASLGVPSGTVPAETVLYGQLTWCFA